MSKDYSNGIDTHIENMPFIIFDNAVDELKNIVDEKRGQYDTIYKDTQTEFVADNNDNKGNGFEAIILNEDVVMNKIITGVKESNDMQDYETLTADNQLVSRSAKTLFLPNSLPYTRWDKNCIDTQYYKPLYILERNEYGETIYDVYMDIVSAEDMDDINTNINDSKMIYVESLECIGIDILSNIYTHLT